MRTRTMRMGPGSITPMVKYIILANVGVFLAQLMVGLMTGVPLGVSGREGLGIIGEYFALVPAYTIEYGFLWQLITYQFLHGGFFHILINMFILWMFGVELEQVWGAEGFLRFYLTCGVVAGISMIGFNYGLIPTVGASGAVMGLLGPFAIYWPNREVFVWGIFPIKVKYWVLVVGGIELFVGISETQAGIANMAHLGGLIMGLSYAWLSDPREPFLQPLKDWLKERKIEKKQEEWKQEQKRREEMVKEADEILDRMQEMSWEDLSDHEKKRIQEISNELSDMDREPPG